MSQIVVSSHERGEGSVRSYTIGFVTSLALTLSAYLLVTQHAAHGWALMCWLALLSVVQLMVQLVCFLHVGRESRPRWNLSVLLFAAGVVFIVVFGSLWIMKNLAYGHHHQVTPTEIIKDEGIQP